MSADYNPSQSDAEMRAQGFVKDEHGRWEIPYENRKRYKPLPATSKIPPILHDHELDPSWQRVDLRPALEGERERITPTVLRFDDSVAGLFYRGCVNGVHSDSGLGKSWIAEITAAQEITAGNHVGWVDFEEPNETTIVERLRQIGVTDDVMLKYLHYYGPVAPFDDLAVTMIGDAARDYEMTFLTVDSLGEAFGLEGIDENKDSEVGPWMRRVLRPLAAIGPAVLPLDHSTKAADNPLHPSGSKRKRAAVTGASYLLEAPVPLTREAGGQLRLTTAKDRHGSYRRGKPVATIDVNIYPDGGTTVHVRPPLGGSNTSPAAHLLGVARAATKAVKDAGRPLSQREFIALMGKGFARDDKLAAIDKAIAAGAIRFEAGGSRGRPNLHHYIRDITDLDQ